MDVKIVKQLKSNEDNYEQIINVFKKQITQQNQGFIIQLLQTRDKQCISQLSHFLASEYAPKFINVDILEEIILFYAGLEQSEQFNFKDIMLLAVVCRQLSLREINVHYYIQIIIDNQLKYLQFIKNIVDYCIAQKNDAYALEIFLYIHISFDTTEIKLNDYNDTAKDLVCQAFKILHCRFLPQKYELSKVLKDYISQVCDVNQYQLTPVASKMCAILQHIVSEESNAATNSTPKTIQNFLTSNIDIYYKLYLLSGLLPYPELKGYHIYHKIVLQHIDKLQNHLSQDDITVAILYQQLINKLNILVLFLHMNDPNSQQNYLKSQLNFTFSATINRCLAAISGGQQIDPDVLFLDVLLLEDCILQNGKDPVNYNIKDKVCKFIDLVYKSIDDTGGFISFCLYYICILCQVYQYQVGDPIIVLYSITGKQIYGQINHQTRLQSFLSYIFIGLLNFVNFTDYSYKMFLELCRTGEQQFDPSNGKGIFVHQRSYLVSPGVVTQGYSCTMIYEQQTELEVIKQKYNQLVEAYNKRKGVPVQNSQKNTEEPNLSLQKELDNTKQLLEEVNQQKVQLERQVQQLIEDKKQLQNQLSISNNNNQMFQAQLNQAQARYDDLQASKIQLQTTIERSKEEINLVKNQMQQQAEEARSAKHLLSQIRNVIHDFKD